MRFLKWFVVFLGINCSAVATASYWEFSNFFVHRLADESIVLIFDCYRPNRGPIQTFAAKLDANGQPGFFSGTNDSVIELPLSSLRYSVKDSKDKIYVSGFAATPDLPTLISIDGDKVDTITPLGRNVENGRLFLDPKDRLYFATEIERVGRVLGDGSLDSTYGESGVFNPTAFLPTERNPFNLASLTAMQFDGDGSLYAIAAGSSGPVIFNAASYGQANPLFGIGGFKRFPTFPFVQGSYVTTDSFVLSLDGHKYVTRSSYGDGNGTYLLRYDDQWNLDRSIGEEGVFWTTEIVAVETLLNPNGGILLVGSSGKILRVSDDAKQFDLLRSKTAVPILYARRAEIDPRGGIFLSEGEYVVGGTFCRLDFEAQLDVSFGQGGCIDTKSFWR